MAIVFLRHGETDFNSSNKWMGLSDLDLNDRGVEQATSAALKLAKIHFTTIFTSPLRRAMHTAEIVQVNQKAESAIVILDELRERCFGELEGRVKTPQDRQRLDSIESVETLESVFQRVNKVVSELMTRKGNSLIVSHSAMYRALVQSELLMPVEHIEYLGNAQWIHLKHMASY